MNIHTIPTEHLAAELERRQKIERELAWATVDDGTAGELVPDEAE